MEPGDLLTDDLFGPIAIDLRRPDIPRGQLPIGVEHEDRIVPDALHEEPVGVFAVDQGARALGHSRAEGEARRGDRHHERHKQQEGVVQRRTDEGTGSRDGSPHGDG